MELLFLLGFHSLRDEMNLMVEVEPFGRSHGLIKAAARERPF